MAEFLRPWVTEFAPDCLVVGGNIAHAWELFAPALDAGLEGCHPGLQLHKAVLFEDAALLGAARVLRDRHEPSGLFATP